MDNLQIGVKNMVCQRCVKAVEEALDQLDIPYQQVSLGEITLKHHLEVSKENQLKNKLSELGFEWLDDKKSKLIERIKNLLISKAREKEQEQHTNLSDLLQEHLGQDYAYLSSIFSSKENITIEKYYILQRIEMVKELLVYDELSLKEIAYQMGFSSSAHLSTQFKKITGLTPSHFKQIKANKRLPLDEVGSK
ncbi:AraC family transcriptional regulator [Penaeicola halotolerans]|uniref:AraC family transcriptional regulator n=1 Tax=Penaeicola halotolerans TaxID=2793196 RepID=UPI001CF87C68|nr:helix-turn-helix domain-containing protein [Penaeicola halotolerans]